MMYLWFSFAALDSLVPYAAVLSIARQRFVETLRYLKNCPPLPPFFISNKRPFSFPDPLVLLLLISRIVD